MAHTITIKYTAPVAPNAQAVSPICRVFAPQACAADHPKMEGTYYDTNVEGWGEGTTLEQFMAQQVSHPGLNAAVRKAVRDGEYTMTDADEKTMLYMEEVAPALKSQGFEIIIDGTEDAVDTETDETPAE